MLIDIADDIWCAEIEHRLTGGYIFPLRMTVLRMADGSLLLHNPIPIDDALFVEIEALGRVRHLIAPNRFHSMYLAAAHERFPGARCYLAPGLPQKRAGLPCDVELTGDPVESFGADLEYRVLRGAPSAGEVVFYHRPSKTLIVSDLVLHISKPRNWRSAVVAWAVGAYKKVAANRFWPTLIKDKQAFSDTLDEILAWDFERVLVGHGDVIHAESLPSFSGALAPLRAQRARP